jgi:diguanylate cyclase (GGDEF)-like protein
VAERLRGDLRATDVAARLGGDEFGVLLTQIPNEAFAIAVSERLLARLIAPIEVAGVTVEVGASIGIAVDSPSMRTVDDLLGDADVAMYQAKALGKGRYHVFSPASSEDRANLTRAWVERGPTVRRSTAAPPLGVPRLEPGAG